MQITDHTIMGTEVKYNLPPPDVEMRMLDNIIETRPEIVAIRFIENQVTYYNHMIKKADINKDDEVQAHYMELKQRANEKLGKLGVMEEGVV